MGATTRVACAPKTRALAADTKTSSKRCRFKEFEDNVADCAQHGLRVVNLDGSGEATLNRNLPKYIEIVKKYGAKGIYLL